MSNPRDPARLRQGLNPLLTQSLGSYHNHSQINTPLSGLSSATHLNSAHTPASSIQPYNPQEWISSPAAGPERARQFPEQGSPLPPPPYSPPRSQRPQSGVFESSPAANTSAARIPPTNLHRPSPEPTAHTSFPPPPGVNCRTSSRERRFGLHSLRRSRENADCSPPESVPPVPSLRPTPLQIQIPHPMPHRIDSASSPGPPAARRAASASAIETPTSARSRSTSQTRWEPGMPLPPPPPGPPPASSRSQSLQSLHRTTTPMASPPTRRPPPSGVTALGPVPPTPANWVDQPQERTHTPQGRGSPALTIDTASAASSVQTGDSSNSAALSSGSLSRARAVRHDKTIVQRRAESRNRHSALYSIDGTIDSVQLTDIVVPSETTLSRRLTINKSTPRSGGQGADDTPRTDEHSTTPRASGSAQRPRIEAATPPFSPHPAKGAAMVDESPKVVPKALPTPPPQTRSASSSRTRFRAMSPAEASSSASASGTKHAVIAQTAEQFCHESIERFQAFAVKESTAATDADRVRLFADFIVSESRIRRERYSSAIGAMGSEIFDLTRDLFRPMVTRRESGASQAEWTPQSSEPTRSHRGSLSSIYRETPGESSSAPASANVPLSPVGGPANNGTWASNYMPSLSPILSLSVSDNIDEADSRGRPSSRWWEGDSSGEGGKLAARSKRESKYMGVPKEAREALQWVDSPQRQDGPEGFSDGRSSSEYPPEKTGWHDSDPSLTPQQIRYSSQSLASSGSPTTPNPAHLDVSRLVTLPPPYPRHHPAVNNNHPELTETRTAVRKLSDLAELDATKERFQVTSNKKREEAAKAAAERRQALRSNLHQEVNVGNMTFAEASAIEQDSVAAEKNKLKELGKTEFEQFQAQVVMPLNDLVTGRIAKATTLFDKLANGLFDDVSSTADMPQEEGDDKPELLEKLTLLKWIFEARETLHRAIYDVLTDRNNRYRDVVLTPYRMAGNQEKLRNAEAFFAEDAAKRQLTFAHEVLARTQQFQGVVEHNVMRGVEVQLSAFWDIAPPLRRLLEEIPPDLEEFNIQVPAAEYEENPSYRAHPLQYLFSLLLHTEKSTYQFIESQTNLLCLLHEVKEAVAHAKAKVVQSEVGDGEGREYGVEERESRAHRLRRQEDQMLTDDLQEKVRVVQEQWNSALGENIKNVKQMLGEHLLQTGGWDETLEEGGVGSV